MKKYKKKNEALTVAFRTNKDTNIFEQIRKLIPGKFSLISFAEDTDLCLRLDTIVIHFDYGDWIIRIFDNGVLSSGNDIYSMKDEVFRKTYEEVIK